VRERVPVRVSIDETAALPGALAAGVADAVCLKVAGCGGIGRLLAAAALVRASGAEVYLASTFDGPLGVAAAVHAAAALASRGAMPPCGLATLGLFADIDNPLPAIDGQIAVPGGPGLGVAPLPSQP
jgi:L-Ala-D/L-Glu epimerase